MKKLALGLFALLLAFSPARAQNTIGPLGIGCNKSFQVSQAAVALTRVVTAAGQTISWCGWVLNAGAAAATAQLQYGTGTNCGTGTTSITPVFSLGINGVLPDHVPVAHFSLPMGADMCLVTTGTGPMQVQLYYSIN